MPIEEPVAGCPFRGLRPFSTTDAPLYVGRKRLVQRLCDAMLGQVPLSWVMGGCGAGKTSFVHAGLVPMLLERGVHPLVLEHPGLDPFDQLSRSGVQGAEADLALALTAVGKGRRVVLILDHLEELALAPSSLWGVSFQSQLSRLVDAVRADRSQLGLIGVLRSESVSRVLESVPGLLPLIEQPGVTLPDALELSEWMAILVGMTRHVGLCIEPRLLDALAADVARGWPGAQTTVPDPAPIGLPMLPVLSLLLLRLWEVRQSDTLRLLDYERLGGLKDLIAAWAERQWAQLPNHVLPRRVLLRLLAQSDPPSGPQVAALPRHLTALADVDAARSVSASGSGSIDTSYATVMALSSSGLVVTNDATGTVELVHEVLLRGWPRLIELYTQEQQFQSWQTEALRRLAEPVKRSSSSSLGDGLLSSARLIEAERWLAERGGEVDARVRRLIEESRVSASAVSRLPQLSAGTPSLASIPEVSPRGIGWFWGVLFGGLFLLLGIAVGRLLFERGEGQLAQELSSERGAHAILLVNQPAQDSAALALAIKAVSPSLRAGRQVPQDAQDGLMTAFSQTKLSLPLHGHEDRVAFALFDPSGDKVVTISNDRTLRVWDSHTGRSLLTLRGHEKLISGIQLSRDGQVILSTSLDGTARLWAMADGALLRTLPGTGAPLEVGSLSPDGRLALLGDRRGGVQMWDVRTGQLLHALVGHTDRVTAAAFSADGLQVVTASWDQTARLWNPLTGEQRAVLAGHTGRLYLVLFSPDGQQVATGSWDQTVRLWRKDGTQQALLDQGSPVQSMVYSPRGDWFVSTGSVGDVTLWSLKSSPGASPPGQRLLGHSGKVFGTDFSMDGLHFVTTGVDRTLRVWDVRLAQPIVVLYGHSGPVYSASFSGSGDRVVTGSYDRTARVWDVRAGQPVAILNGHQRGLTDSQFSPDGKRIVTASEDHTACIWRWQDESPKPLVLPHTHAVFSAQFSPDGKMVATGSSDAHVRLWNAETGALVSDLGGHSGPVFAVGFSPTASLLVSGGEDGTLRLWDPTTRQLVRTERGHQGNLISLAFSPDGSLLATSGSEGELWLRDGKTAAPLRRLMGHTDAVSQVEFFTYGGPGGELRVVTGSPDRSLRFWDPKTGALLFTNDNFPDVVNSISTSADGRRLLVASGEQGIRLWDIIAGMPLGVLPGFFEEVLSVRYSPADPKHFVIGSSTGSARVYRDDYPANLAGMLTAACERLRYQPEFQRVQRECSGP